MTVTLGPFGEKNYCETGGPRNSHPLVPPGMAAIGPYVRSGPLDARLGAARRLLGGADHRVPPVLVDRVEGRLIHPAGNENRTVGGQRGPGQPRRDLGSGAGRPRIGRGVT